MEVGGEGDYIPIATLSPIRMTSAFRWAATRALLMFQNRVTRSYPCSPQLPVLFVFAVATSLWCENARTGRQARPSLPSSSASDGAGAGKAPRWRTSSRRSTSSAASSTPTSSASTKSTTPSRRSSWSWNCECPLL